MAAASATPPSPAPSSTAALPARLRDALAVAVLGGLLALPFIGLRTVEDGGALVVQTRWGALGWTLLLVFFARLLLRAGIDFWQQRRPAKRLVPTRGHTAVRRASAGAILGLALLLPLLLPGNRYVIDTATTLGIYVMLGWGLNVVVGLAGLLDLGYVAFYAVGAYAFALLSTSVPLKCLLRCPCGRRILGRVVVLGVACRCAGILAAFWGVILGFPVLAPAGRLLGHRHLGIRRDHPPCAD